LKHAAFFSYYLNKIIFKYYIKRKKILMFIAL